MKTSVSGRDAAKFFAGWAAAETVGHWALGLLGTDMFPVTVGRFTFTSEWNIFAMVAWPIALAVLAYVGWCAAERPSPHREPPTHSAAA
jgi:hypothetical protein